MEQACLTITVEEAEEVPGISAALRQEAPRSQVTGGIQLTPDQPRALPLCARPSR